MSCPSRVWTRQCLKDPLFKYPALGDAARSAAPLGLGLAEGVVQLSPVPSSGEGRSGLWRGSDRSLVQLGIWPPTLF
eukprot:13399637-Alexandrium_andersonii.AAC.1